MYSQGLCILGITEFYVSVHQQNSTAFEGGKHECMGRSIAVVLDGEGGAARNAQNMSECIFDASMSSVSLSLANIMLQFF
jgi:hypothetical protein